MDILLLTLPIALLLALIFVIIFIISVKSGQFDDLKTPSYKVLLEDQIDTKKQTDKGSKHE